MAKLKHNDPCHCGSGRRYRSCHLRQDREDGAQAPRETARPTSAASPAGRPRWLRVLPGIVGLIGVVASGWIAVAVDPTKGGAVLLLVGIVVVAMYVFGDPPPPNDKAGDPAAINFGR